MALFARQGGGDGMACTGKINDKVFVELLGIDGGNNVPRALAGDGWTDNACAGTFNVSICRVSWR